MIAYILCEILIICSANLAKLNLDLLGLEEKDELQTEAIGDAMKRFIDNSTVQARVKQALEKGKEIDAEDAREVYQEINSDAFFAKNLSARESMKQKIEIERQES